MGLSQGGRANRTGKILENQVDSTLTTHHYFFTGNEVTKESLLAPHVFTKRYGRQVNIGSGIYNTPLKVDFYVVGLPAMPSGLIIECKWQQNTGSVDEKFPYLNFQNHYPTPTIIVIGGEGMRQGAIDWLEKQVQHNKNLFKVYNLERFIAWANNKF